MAAFVGTLQTYIGADISDFEKKMKRGIKLIGGWEKTLGSLSKSAKMATAVISSIGAAALAVGVKIERANRNIQIGTGASGEALKRLQADFRAIAVLGPQTFDDSAKAIADLNTMTGATGETLQTLAMTVLDASRMMGTDLGGTISSLGKLLNNWNMSAEQGVSVMDKLFKASQDTGLGLDQIAQGVTAAGASMRQMGLDIDESIALISGLDKAGINAQQAMKGLSKALLALNKEGIKDTSEGLKIIIASIKEASSTGAALDIGKDVFGIKAGVDIALAIREGKFEVEGLIKSIENSRGVIAETSRETMTLGERWSTVGNQFAMALEPLGTKLVKMAEKYIPDVSRALGDFTLDLDEGTIKIFAMVAAIAPATMALGVLAGSIGNIISLFSTLIPLVAGPVGLTVSLGFAVGALASYTAQSEKARQAAEDLEDAQKWLNERFQEVSTAQMQNELLSLRKELVSLENQAIDTWTMVARATAYGERGVSQIVTQEEAAITRMKEKLAARVNVLEKEIAQRQVQEGAEPKIAAPVRARPLPRERIGGGGAGGGGGVKTGGGRSGPSALDIFVQEARDKIKYFNESGEMYLTKIDEMQAKLKPLSDDWKKLEDLKINIDDSLFSASLQKIRDQMQYMGKDGVEFIPDLKKMLDGLEPLSDEWKKVQDTIKNITETAYSKKWSGLAWEFSEGLLSATEYARLLEVEIAGLEQGTEKWRARFSELQNIKTSELGTLLDSLSSQFENGALSNAEYEAALAGIISEFQDFPKAAKMAQEALDAFQKQTELTTVSVGQQLSSALKATTKDFNEMWGEGIERTVDGFLNAAIRGDDFGDMLRKLGEDIVFTTLKMVILNQMMSLFSGLGGGGGASSGAGLGAWMAGFTGFGGFSKGGAFNDGHLVPFARGGIVHRPTVFPMASGAGLMGEAGPEAVMPLARDSHGRLGVTASGANEEPPSVVVNVINESSQPVTATQTGPSFDEQMRQMVVGVILRDQATNGPITQNFRRR